MLNMNFTQSVSIDTHSLKWVASPMPGVVRKPLAREEAEQGHATSIVCYEPGASFSSHGHPKGEEILVLEGVFSDQTGDYQAGTYFRNPEGFSHAPFSKEGCTILVKLHQFQADDSAHLAIQTNNAKWHRVNDSLEYLGLHHHKDEQVFMMRSGAELKVDLDEALKGLEIYVISGELLENGHRFSAGSWLRRPALNKKLHNDSQEDCYQLGSDTVVWIKMNHL
ncbi:cupin domain-containing protein [Amphritea japonica]|uniref:Cupin n=1 Tax=Amphritea japonica ATCC BAA-1530 TaxID=1278309 RepID=A0A7R6PB04_9GAMM|nr:cupin domain-containing protein [Amphritea japonica]BBB25821.1 cupin [Amphritea japonica ATCC BAA-1530]